MEVNRKIRVLRNTKASKVVTGSGYPNKRDGKDGDIQIRVTADGLLLLAKNNGRWYYTKMEPVGG